MYWKTNCLDNCKAFFILGNSGRARVILNSCSSVFFLSHQENYGIIKCEGQINGKSVKVSSYSKKYDSEWGLQLRIRRWTGALLGFIYSPTTFMSTTYFFLNYTKDCFLFTLRNVYFGFRCSVIFQRIPNLSVLVIFHKWSISMKKSCFKLWDGNGVEM